MSEKRNQPEAGVEAVPRLWRAHRDLTCVKGFAPGEPNGGKKDAGWAELPRRIGGAMTTSGEEGETEWSLPPVRQAVA